MKAFSAARRALLAVLGVSACAPITAFDALTPKDEGHVLERDVAYGPDPLQRLDVYGPLNCPTNAPVMVFIHGGGWRADDKANYDFAARAFTAKGYVVVMPNYRLVPAVHFPAFNEDGARALRWTQDHIAEFGGDPSRIVLAGHSAGAYIAAMLALDPHYCADAGFDIARIKGVAGLSGPYDFYPLDTDYTIDAFSQAPDPALAQPMHFARADAPPFFLGWGDADDLVGRRNIESLSTALRNAGASVESKIYPGLNHGETLLALSVLLRDRGPVLEDVTRFADRVTRRR